MPGICQVFLARNRKLDSTGTQDILGFLEKPEAVLVHKPGKVDEIPNRTGTVTVCKRTRDTWNRYEIYRNPSAGSPVALQLPDTKKDTNARRTIRHPAYPDLPVRYRIRTVTPHSPSKCSESIINAGILRRPEKGKNLATPYIHHRKQDDLLSLPGYPGFRYFIRERESLEEILSRSTIYRKRGIPLLLE